MNIKNKKTLTIIAIVILGVFIVIASFFQTPAGRKIFQQTVPLLPTTISTTPTPILERGVPIVPKHTNIDPILSHGDQDLSQTEIEKISSNLPIRIDNYKTSTGLSTTINIFTSSYEPASLIHIEIYGVNYNHPEITQSDALAYKESFLLAKKALTTRNINVKNLQIIYGTRQYIQDTASYWVSAFGILN